MYSRSRQNDSRRRKNLIAHSLSIVQSQHALVIALVHLRWSKLHESTLSIHNSKHSLSLRIAKQMIEFQIKGAVHPFQVRIYTTVLSTIIRESLDTGLRWTRLPFQSDSDLFFLLSQIKRFLFPREQCYCPLSQTIDGTEESCLPSLEVSALMCLLLTVYGQKFEIKLINTQSRFTISILRIPVAFGQFVANLNPIVPEIQFTNASVSQKPLRGTFSHCRTQTWMYPRIAFAPPLSDRIRNPRQLPFFPFT